MKEFDSTEALNGAKLVTRCGYKVRDFRKREENDDLEGDISDYPYRAEIDEGEDAFAEVYAGAFAENGRYYVSGWKCDLDLFLSDELSK